MISARTFLLLWAALTAAVIAYALIDLELSPSLWQERHFSMQPDLTQIWEVRHWGARLVRERAWTLLVPNALVLGGVGALVAHAFGRWIAKRRKRGDDAARDSIGPPSVPSIPPPPA